MAQVDASHAPTHVAVEALAACPFSMAEAYAVEYLRAAEANGVQATINVSGRFPAVLHHRVGLTFAVYADALESGRRHDALRIRWSSAARLLPDFQGSIRFRIDADRTRVLVDGSYDPPLGAVGRLFDLAVGRIMARASMQDLADRVAAYLTQRERLWRAEQAPLSS
jgi:hypothetical protein